ncbi:MAG TPA: succinylglutamate desuccinylase/aspartoacylase family protein [Acetobacteraceae bacterium]|nr:succinylglutamate desuccinylase/aspartoacylase family protein [Acetobacteraceae bacterium]
MLEIEGLAVPRGGERRGQIPVLSLPDGSTLAVPLRVICGAAPGPTLYLGAAIHGDEVNGIAILARALATLDPARLRGNVVCIPVQHPLALLADHRLPLAQFLKSPLDQVPSDAWTCFPGDPAGNIAQILAATLFRVISRCDAAIDVHTPTRGGRYVPIAILPGPGLAGSDAARALGEAMGTGWTVAGTEGMYVAPGILCVEAARAGIPALTFEIGEGGRLEGDCVATGARCVLNGMRHLGMLDSPAELPEQRHLMRGFLGLRAGRGGLLTTLPVLGDPVRRGDVLCRIFGVFGDVLETITAPEDGLFVRATTMGTVSQGERVATLGLL